MALTFRSDKGAALSINELDNNFRHFTGSHEVSGSITLTEGGVSNTLTATDIANLRAGKSIVETTDSRAKGTGVSTNYAQYDVLYNSIDNTTYLDLSEDGTIDFRADDATVFNISKPPSGQSDGGVITLGRDCIYKTRVKCDLQVDRDLQVNRNLHVRGALTASGDIIFPNATPDSYAKLRGTLKVGDDSVVLSGQNTSFIKAAVITSVDNTDGGQDLANAGVFFDTLTSAGSVMGNTRIILGHASSTLTTVNSDNGQGSENLAINTNQITFQVNDSDVVKMGEIGGNTEFLHDIKYTGVNSTADTTGTNHVLVLNSDGIIVKGDVVGNLGGDPAGGEENQFAFATASFDNVNILSDSKVGLLNFVFGSELASSVDGQTVTITTGSNFTVPLTLDDVATNGSSTDQNISLTGTATLSVAGTSTFTGASTFSSNIFAPQASNEGLYLGTSTADAGSVLKVGSSRTLELKNQETDKNITINTTGNGNVGILNDSPSARIHLGVSIADTVKLYADTDNTATDILMLDASNVVKKTTRSELLIGSTVLSGSVDASDVTNLDYFTIADLPDGTLSGSDSIIYAEIPGIPTINVDSVGLVGGAAQGDIKLNVNGTLQDTATAFGLDEADEPTFAKLSLTNIAGDTTDERRPLVIVGNEIMSASADYATVDQVNTIVAEGGAFILSFTGSDDGTAVQTFDIFDSSSKFNINTPGNGLTLTSNGSYGINLNLTDGVVSSSAQIANEISGAFGEVSGAIASDIADNVTNISTNTTNITTLTGATSSYYTQDSDVDGTGITNNSLTIAGNSVSLGGSVTIDQILNNSTVLSESIAYGDLTGTPELVSGSSQISFNSIADIDALIISGTLSLAPGAGQGEMDLRLNSGGVTDTLSDNIAVNGLQTGDSPEFVGLTLSGLTANSSVTPLVIDTVTGIIYTGSNYTTADDVDPYDLDITTSGDNGSITITNAETLMISGAGGLDITSDTNTLLFTIGNGILSSSAQIATDISSAINDATGSLLSNITFFSSSAQVDFTSIANAEGMVSGTIAFKNGDNDTATLLPSETASFVQNITGDVFDIEVTNTGDGVQVNLYAPDGVISGSSQVDITATDGYTTFSSSIASDIADNTSAININTGNVSTNSTNITNNSSSIASLNAATSSYLTTLDGSISGSAFSSTAQGTLSASINGVATIVDLGLETTDDVTFNGLTITGTDTIEFENLTQNGSTTPLVYDASSKKIHFGAAYSSYTADSDFSSFIASGSTGGGSIGGAGTLNINGGTGITTIGAQNGAAGQAVGITVNLDPNVSILSSSAQIASDISGAFGEASASIVTLVSNNSASAASDIFTNITNIANNTAVISTLNTFTGSIQTDVDNLESSASIGLRFEDDNTGFNLVAGDFTTASFKADGGSGLTVNANNSDRSITYTLNGVVSSSSQIHTQISGAFGALSASFIDLIEDNASSIISINASTSSLENHNAYATASIANGDSLLASGLSSQLTFEAGDGIYLAVENNAILITASGGGGGNGSDDGYIGDAQNHTAGGNLDMDGNNIDNIGNANVQGNIILEGGASTTSGKIAFSNDTNNTYIQGTTTNAGNEDLRVNSQNNIFLMPADFIGVGTTVPTSKLDVVGTIRAQGATSDVIAGRDVKVERNIVNADHPLTDGIFFSDTLGQTSGGDPTTSSTIDIKINSSYDPTDPDSTSRILLEQEKLVFNDDQARLVDYAFKTPTNVNALRINGSNNSSFDGNVGINTNAISYQLTVRGRNDFLNNQGHSKILLVSPPNGYEADIRFEDLPESNPSVAAENATDVVMIHPTTGQLFTTASEAISGNDALSVTIEGEVISSNTIALYDNQTETATFPAMTDPEEGSTSPLQDNYGYLRAEFYGRSGNNIQAARTVFVWNSGSGDNLIATTVEDIRTDGSHTLFDINSVTGSWDGSGNLVMSLQQYNQGTGVEVDYKLRYITI